MTRVLMGDFEALHRLGLEQILRVDGIELVDTTGDDVLGRLLEALPDVIVLDLGLPVMNGFELAAHIRQRPHLVDIPMIAVTGYGQEADRRRTTAEGFVEHLVKPVDVDTLEHVIRAQRRSTARTS